jgi:hypothetical protein
MPWPLYSREKCPQYTFDRTLWRRVISCLLPEIKHRILGDSAHRQVTTPSELSHFFCVAITHIICALLVETSLQLNVWRMSSVRTRQRMVSCMWKLATAHTSFWLKVDLLTLQVCLFVCLFGFYYGRLLFLLLFPPPPSPYLYKCVCVFMN